MLVSYLSPTDFRILIRDMMDWYTESPEVPWEEFLMEQFNDLLETLEKHPVEAIVTYHNDMVFLDAPEEFVDFVIGRLGYNTPD